MTPVELTEDTWDLIIGILGEESDTDTKSLKALCLTCKAMVPLCRRQLFSTVALIDDDYYNPLPTAIHSFHNLISRNPAVIQYIRHFIHHISFPHDVHVHQILNVLIASSALQSVELSSPTLDTWDEFPTVLQTCLEQLIQLPSITRIKLSEIRAVPLSLLYGCTYAKHVTLSLVRFAMPINLKLVECPVRICRPRYLYADGRFFDGLRSLIQPGEKDGNRKVVDFSGLEDVHFVIGSAQHMELVNLVVSLSALLRSFHLQTYDEVPLAGLGAVWASTSTVPALTKIRLEISVKTSLDGFLGGLVSELRMISGTNVLEHIFFDIDVGEDLRLLAPTGDSAAFDSLVTTPGSFPMLKVVMVRLVGINGLLKRSLIRNFSTT